MLSNLVFETMNLYSYLACSNSIIHFYEGKKRYHLSVTTPNLTLKIPFASTAQSGKKNHWPFNLQQPQRVNAAIGIF